MDSAAQRTEAGDRGAAVVYCRSAHRNGPDQSGTDQREAACRELAARHSVQVANRVYIDVPATAWHHGRTGRQWDLMLRAASTPGITHLVLYGTGELQRHHPWDLSSALHLAASRRLTLLDPAAQPQAFTADQRNRLLTDTVALRSRRDRSAAASHAGREAAAALGRPPGGGRRPYAYTTGDYRVVIEEAAVVREIYDRFLAGESLGAIARALNESGHLTSCAGTWTSTGVTRILAAPRYAGWQTEHGAPKLAPDGSRLFGDWHPCISPGTWQAAQHERVRRAEESAGRLRPRRHYPLVRLTRCTCGRSMVGSTVADHPTYACTGNSLRTPKRCSRHISAERLEAHINEQVITALEHLDASQLPATAAVMDAEAVQGRDTAQSHLNEEPLTEAERAALTTHIRRANRTAVLRSPDALYDVPTGRHARRAWARLSRRHRAEVLRFLIHTITIGPVIGPRSVFNSERIRITWAPP